MCDEAGTEIISARLICDGVPNCNGTRADESLSVCNPWRLKLVTISPTLINFSVALCCAIYILKIQKIKEEEESDEECETKRKIAKGLKLITQNLKNPCTENEKGMKAYIEKLSKRDQLLLVNISRNIEVSCRDGSSESLFESAAESMFAVKAQTGILLGLVKNDKHSSMKLKREVLSLFEPKGWVSKTKTKLRKKLPPQVRIALSMVQDILSSLMAILTIPLQDVKDLCTIVALHTFYQDVLQGRLHLVDNLPIDQYVIYLITIFALIFLLKVLISVECHDPKEGGGKPTCRCRLFGFSLNLNAIPFVAEIRINMEIFQLALMTYTKKNTIAELLANLATLDVEEDINQNWTKICSVSKELCHIEHFREALVQQKSLIKMTACLGKGRSSFIGAF